MRKPNKYLVKKLIKQKREEYKSNKPKSSFDKFYEFIGYITFGWIFYKLIVLVFSSK